MSYTGVGQVREIPLKVSDIKTRWYNKWTNNGDKGLVLVFVVFPTLEQGTTVFVMDRVSTRNHLNDYLTFVPSGGRNVSRRTEWKHMSPSLPDFW